MTLFLEAPRKDTLKSLPPERKCYVHEELLKREDDQIRSYPDSIISHENKLLAFFHFNFQIKPYDFFNLLSSGHHRFLGC